jgi:metal-responsive CopG/Arc/MetJ family transcriptional regulator
MLKAMKTTIDLPETLLAEVRAVAEKRGWTVRVVFEESLRAFVQQEETRAKSKPFRLAHTVVKGRTFPSMSFAEMLQATAPDRLPE